MIPAAPPDEYCLYGDGGSRGNPGAAAFGFVILNADGAEVAADGGAIGNTTNNVAEYTALVRGLERALELGVQRIRVRMDSELVVRQMNGHYRVKHPNLLPLHAQAQALRRRFAGFRIEHVRRADNARADALANAALDALKSPGE
jgi:ribonuclease HI